VTTKDRQGIGPGHRLHYVPTHFGVGIHYLDVEINPRSCTFVMRGHQFHVDGWAYTREALTAQIQDLAKKLGLPYAVRGSKGGAA